MSMYYTKLYDVLLCHLVMSFLFAERSSRHSTKGTRC